MAQAAHALWSLGLYVQTLSMPPKHLINRRQRRAVEPLPVREYPHMFSGVFKHDAPSPVARYVVLAVACSGGWPQFEVSADWVHVCAVSVRARDAQWDAMVFVGKTSSIVSVVSKGSLRWIQQCDTPHVVLIIN